MRDRSAGTRHAVLLVLISCLPILGTLLIAPVLPEMARHFASVPGVAYLVPFVQTAPAFVLALTGVFAGHVAERVGR
jgi:MFS family permease